MKGFSHLILGVENIKSVINSGLSAFDRENRLVFFQTIPTSPNLPTLPVGISVMEPIFDPPKYDNLIEFTYNPKKTKGSGGIFEVFLKIGGKSKAECLWKVRFRSLEEI